MSSIDNLKKEAKRWLKALRAGDADARARLERAYPGAPAEPVLRDVQHALARGHGFENWKAFTAAVEQHLGFESRLADVIERGRDDELERLLGEHPEALGNNRLWVRILVRASGRSTGAAIDRLLSVLRRHYSGLTIVNMHADADMAPGGAQGFTALHEAAAHGNVDAITALLAHGADSRVRDSVQCRTPAAWARSAGHTAAADLILATNVDIFDAIDADRADLVARIVDRDAAAIDRPFKAYASCGDGTHAPGPSTTPLEWATRQQRTNAARELVARGAAARTPADVERAARIVTFLQSACWDHHTHGKPDHRLLDRAAERLLANDSAIATDNLYTAIVCGELDTVRRLVAERPDAAREPGGARGWTPILYSAYTRFSHPGTIATAVEIARVLLDAGANPNDFYMAGDARYSVLTGIAGEGEQDSPRQPYAPEMFQLLLERGAEPFDIQVLYDTHFSGDMLWWLDLVYEHTRRTDRRSAWDDPDWPMLDMGGYGSGARFILWTALKQRDLRLAEWALERGANPNPGPARAKSFSKASLYEDAMRDGFTELAELLVRHGAPRVMRALDTLDDYERFVTACFGLDRETAAALAATHPEYLASSKTLFHAAERDRADVVALLLDLGVPVNVRDHQGTNALHRAAARNALQVAALLIDRGVEIDARDATYGGAPIGWASHFDHVAMIDFLSRYSRNVGTLAGRGYVDRVREILRDDPSLARQVSRDGTTPLWWLPEDEGQALALVDLMVAAGADPAARNRDGHTAADWARERGMLDVAARLESR